LTTLERAIRLQKVDLFTDLETDLLALVASIAEVVEIGKDNVLFEESRPLSALYVLLEGRIQMGRGGQTMFTVGPDETIGNWALFDNQPSVVTATAVEDSRLLKIEREDFFDLLADHSEITRNLFQALFQRVRSLLTKGLDTTASGSIATRPGNG
jgi:CRP-like cAMP-binding protein